MHDDVTAEQVCARVHQPTAALLGPDGIVLPLGDDTIIGRDPRRCDLAILHASVSAVHARIARVGDAWTILDLGSRNGTAVDGRPAPGTLTAHTRVRLGLVELTFWPSPVAVAPRRRRRTTLQGELAATEVTADLPIELVVCGDGGMVRVCGQAIHLTARELRLLQILAIRRRDVDDAELAYVPSSEIAAVLGFRSIDADSDNVRELVLRVRRKLRAAGAGELIHSRRGAGYKIAA
jgi:hypothetical protein